MEHTADEHTGYAKLKPALTRGAALRLSLNLQLPHGKSPALGDPAYPLSLSIWINCYYYQRFHSHMYSPPQRFLNAATRCSPSMLAIQIAMSVSAMERGVDVLSTRTLDVGVSVSFFRWSALAAGG